MSAMERTTPFRVGASSRTIPPQDPRANEQIVVTRDSDPPLRAGTYFVSLMLRTTGAVAEVTVTAEFDAAAPRRREV